MKTQITLCPFKHLIVLTAAGTMDLAASKAALSALLASPGLETSREALLDLRGIECELSTTDIFEVAAFVSLSRASLSAGKKIAVLVAEHRPGHLPFNKAQFLEMCADNSGLDMRAFEDYAAADEWLDPPYAHAPQHAATMPGPMSPFPGSLADIAHA